MTEHLQCLECGNTSPPQPIKGTVVCLRTHLHRRKRPVEMKATK